MKNEVWLNVKECTFFMFITPNNDSEHMLSYLLWSCVRLCVLTGCYGCMWNTVEFEWDVIFLRAPPLSCSHAVFMHNGWVYPSSQPQVRYCTSTVKLLHAHCIAWQKRRPRYRYAFTCKKMFENLNKINGFPFFLYAYEGGIGVMFHRWPSFAGFWHGGRIRMH